MVQGIVAEMLGTVKVWVYGAALPVTLSCPKTKASIQPSSWESASLLMVALMSHAVSWSLVAHSEPLPTVE